MENKMAALDIANDSGIPTSAANKKAPQPESNTSASKQTQPGSVASSLREQFLSHKSPLKIPIVDPAKTTVLPTAPVLTADQQAKYDILLEKVKEWKEIPAEAGKGGPVTESEIMWMSRECLLRYLRATKWDNAEAAKRLLGTLSWRREYGVEDLTSDYISAENETGKQVIFGYDLGGRPCQYLSPGRQNTEPSPKQVQHLVFMVERSIDLMLPGVETLALLISFQATKNMGPGMGLARDCLNILQTHYPERLGKALLINIPWLVNGFLKLISPFIDPMTKEKLKFNCDMRQFVPTEQLWTEFQGDLKFEYDHKAYWSAFNSLCEEKAAEKRQRWVDGGKHYGESEMYMRGGDAPSVGKGPALEIEKVKVEENGGHVPPVGEASAAEMSEKVREKDSAAPGTQSNGNMDVLAMPA